MSSMSDSHLLRAGEARASVMSLGAECRQWQIGARDMLWAGDAAVWPCVAPVLFPVCGWSRDGLIRVGGTHHPMPVHGFAAQSCFAATRISESAMRFVLEANATTRAHYPFNFVLTITYALTPLSLDVGFKIENRDTQVMPYAVGLHPGFAVDWHAGPHRFVFEKEERAEVPVIARGGLFSSRRRPVPLQINRLDLSPDLFAAEALCFLETRSRAFVLEGRDGRLRIEAPDFPHLVLWNRATAPFLAVESWTGTGDPEGFEGSFLERPSMIHLEARASRIHHVRYFWEPLGRGQASP